MESGIFHTEDIWHEIYDARILYVSFKDFLSIYFHDVELKNRIFFFLFSLLMVKSLPHHTQEKIRMKQIKLETVDMTSLPPLPHPVSCFYEILWSVINEHKWAFQSTISAKIKNSLVRWELMSWWTRTRMKMNVKRNFFIWKLLLQAVRLS